MGLYQLLNKTYDSLDERISSIKHPVLIILIIGLLIRFLFLPLTNVDSWGWYRTGENIISGEGFYDRSGYNYGPAFGYLVSIPVIICNALFNVGTFSQQSDSMITLQPYFDFSPALQTPEFLAIFKIMMIVGDVLAAFAVRWIIKYYTNDQKKADTGFALLFLSPIILIESSIHGMFDIYSGLLSLLSIYFVLNRKYFLAGFSLTSAALMKIFPAYLFPVMIAFVLKQNKDDRKKAVKNLLSAVAGGVTSLVILYYPQIMNGTFGDTWEYLFGRVSSANSVLGSVTDHLPLLLAGLVALVVIVLVLKHLHMFSKVKIPTHLSAKQSAVLIILVILVVFAGLVAVNGGVSEMFSDLFHTSYIIGIGVQGFAFLVSIYLAYKLYHSELEDQSKLLMMVGTLAIATCFLWVPMPEYLILILPLVCVYAMTYDRRYITPFIFISVGAAFFIIMVEGPAALFVSVAEYTDLISIDTVTSITKAYVSGPGVGDYSIYQIIFCIIGAGTQLIGTIMLFAYRFRPYRLEERRI